jgi:hypothetical protein
VCLPACLLDLPACGLRVGQAENPRDETYATLGDIDMKMYGMTHIRYPIWSIYVFEGWIK